MHTISITLRGRDRPGVAQAVFAALAAVDAEVVDIEQVVVRGNLTLAVLIGTDPSQERPVRDAVGLLGSELDLAVSVESGVGDNQPRRSGRAVVVALGSPLPARAVSALTETIATHGANIDRIRRLSRTPVTTIELDVSGAQLAGLRRELALVSHAEQIDVAVAPAGLARRGRRLVVMDVDSTLIQDEVIELLAAHAGRGAEVGAITAAAMRGELDFADSLRERVSALAGLPEAVLAQTYAAVRLTPGARTVVRTLLRLDFTVAVVSGGFLEIVQPLADELGIQHARANRLEVVDGRLTGRVLGEIVDRAGKARALREFAALEGLPLARTVAIGDGANDLDMLQAAGLGIAFNAKPLVAEQADTAVTVPYLDAVLYLLGITRDDIDEADAADETGRPD